MSNGVVLPITGASKLIKPFLPGVPSGPNVLVHTPIKLSNSTTTCKIASSLCSAVNCSVPQILGLTTLSIPITCANILDTALRSIVPST